MPRSATTSSRWTRRSLSIPGSGRRRGISPASPIPWSSARRVQETLAGGHVARGAARRRARRGRDPLSGMRWRTIRGSSVQPDVRDPCRAGSGREREGLPATRDRAGIFISFKNVLQFARKKPLFGIAQIGKSFRNEITPGTCSRAREFEQMEMEYFVPPADAAEWHERWMEERMRRYTELGIRPEKLAPPRPRPRRASPTTPRRPRHRVPLPDVLVGLEGTPIGATSTTQHEVLRREA